MKKGIILNFKRFDLLNYVTQNKILILLCIIYIIGIVVGCIALSDDNWILKFAKSFLDDYTTLHSSASFFSKFLNCLVRYVSILVLYFLSGASMLGIALTPFITLWIGIFFGTIASRLYALYGIGGIAFNAIIIIPPAVLFILVCFFAAKHSIDFSLMIAKLTLPHSKPINLFISFKNYCSKYLIFLIFILASILLEIFLNLLFLDFFNF